MPLVTIRKTPLLPILTRQAPSVPSPTTLATPDTPAAPPTLGAPEARTPALGSSPSDILSSDGGLSKCHLFREIFWTFPAKTKFFPTQPLYLQD